MSLCVAGDWQGDIVTSTDPTGGSGAWHLAYVDNSVAAAPISLGIQAGITSISCPSETLCMASDDAGNVLTTQNPTGGAGAWTLKQAISIPAAPSKAFAQVACPAISRCFGVYDNFADVTDDPFAGTSWTPVAIDQDGHAATGISCPSVRLCVVVDDRGNVIIGGPGQLTAARIRVLLHRALSQYRQPSIATLLRRRSYSLPFKSPAAASVVTRWLASPTGHHPHARPRTVALGGFTFQRAASRTLRLRLTKLGLVLLRHRGHLWLTAEITFSLPRSQPFTAKQAFFLRR